MYHRSISLLYQTLHVLVMVVHPQVCTYIIINRLHYIAEYVVVSVFIMPMATQQYLVFVGKENICIKIINSTIKEFALMPFIFVLF
jgi:hypothetical protein